MDVVFVDDDGDEDDNDGIEEDGFDCSFVEIEFEGENTGVWAFT